MKITPFYNGSTTIVTIYNVTDNNDSIYFSGTKKECEEYIKRHTLYITASTDSVFINKKGDYK
jgi:hypothetical protein